MTFSQKRFVDIGQALYIEWMKTSSPLGLSQCSEDQRQMAILNMKYYTCYESLKKYRNLLYKLIVSMPDEDT